MESEKPPLGATTILGPVIAYDDFMAVAQVLRGTTDVSV